VLREDSDADEGQRAMPPCCCSDGKGRPPSSTGPVRDDRCVTTVAWRSGGTLGSHLCRSESELGGLSLSEAVSGVKSWTSRMWTSTLYYSVSFFA
jgi:hypothetical protein